MGEGGFLHLSNHQNVTGFARRSSMQLVENAMKVPFAMNAYASVDVKNPDPIPYRQDVMQAFFLCSMSTTILLNWVVSHIKM